MNIELKSTLTCPDCGYKKDEEMPTNACKFFYECQKCNVLIKPNKGDCCVYCSFGAVPCPPIQVNNSCWDACCFNRLKQTSR